MHVSGSEFRRFIEDMPKDFVWQGNTCLYSGRDIFLYDINGRQSGLSFKDTDQIDVPHYLTVRHEIVTESYIRTRNYHVTDLMRDWLQDSQSI